MASYSVNDREIRRSLNLTISAVTFGMVFFTIFGAPVGSSLYTGFMRKLGADDFVYSLVMALPVLGGVTQIFGAYFLERTGKRKFLFLACGALHRILWIPVAIIPLIIGGDQHAARIISITVLITFSSLGSSVNSVAFNSWMGNLVPKDIAGRFFGLRALISTISGAVAGLAVGAFIDKVDSLNGFALVFIIGALFGCVDIFTFIWVKDPPMVLSKEKPSIRKMFTDPFKNRNYIKLCLFATVFAFGVNFAGPFFNVYMIENLKMSYFMIALSTTVMTSLTTVLFVRRWGSLSDHFGNKPVVIFCSIGISVQPLMWIFTSSTNYVMAFVVCLLGGIFWSGYNLAIFNQSVWFAPDQNRSAYVACFTISTSVVGTSLANICGGVFMQYMRPYFDHLAIPFILGRTLTAFDILFTISTVIRVLAILFLLPLIHEEKSSTVKNMLGVYTRSFKIGMKKR